MVVVVAEPIAVAEGALGVVGTEVVAGAVVEEVLVIYSNI